MSENNKPRLSLDEAREVVRQVRERLLAGGVDRAVLDDGPGAMVLEVLPLMLLALPAHSVTDARIGQLTAQIKAKLDDMTAADRNDEDEDAAQPAGNPDVNVQVQMLNLSDMEDVDPSTLSDDKRAHLFVSSVVGLARMFGIDPDDAGYHFGHCLGVLAGQDAARRGTPPVLDGVRAGLENGLRDGVLASARGADTGAVH